MEWAHLVRGRGGAHTRTHTSIYIHTSIHVHISIHTCTSLQTDGQTNGQTDKQIDNTTRLDTHGHTHTPPPFMRVHVHVHVRLHACVLLNDLFNNYLGLIYLPIYLSIHACAKKRKHGDTIGIVLLDVVLYRSAMFMFMFMSILY